MFTELKSFPIFPLAWSLQYLRLSPDGDDQVYTVLCGGRDQIQGWQCNPILLLCAEYLTKLKPSLVCPVAGWPVSRTIRKNKHSRHLSRSRRRREASVPASAHSIVCHFLHEMHCEYCLKQLGSSDPYHRVHNSVYMTRRKCGHGAHFGECVCVFWFMCMCSL